MTTSAEPMSRMKEERKSEAMCETKSEMHFRLMCFMLGIRNLFIPPSRVLKEAEIKQGDSVLDFGCGPGTYSLAAARLVGEKGNVFALDVHPLAIKSVNRRALRYGRKNIVPILAESENTGLADKSLDIILAYDVFHEIDEPAKTLAEWNRILRDGGVLSFSDHHLKEADILSNLTRDNYFNLEKKGKRTYTFRKNHAAKPTG